LKVTDVSEECIASIFRVEEYAEQKPEWDQVSSRALLATCFRASLLHDNRCEKLKSYMLTTVHFGVSPTQEMQTHGNKCGAFVRGQNLRRGRFFIPFICSWHYYFARNVIKVKFLRSYMDV
jgi:hypothetical protein